MKSKQELKKVFENGDKPKQEDFWDLIESYFHRDEPVTLEELSLLKSNLATVDKTNNGTETLGNVDTKEQVNAKINSAIDALKANAPETYDTLKEIADYIANDSNAEAALLQLINTKLDKPTMTNNYYGLWDDTNKIFVDGQLKYENNYNVSQEPLKIKNTPIVPKEDLSSLFMGTEPTNNMGQNNFIFGYNSGGGLTTGYYNVLIGNEANKTLTTGIGNTIIAGGGSGGYDPSTNTINKEITAKHNVAIGTSSVHNVTSGSRNVGVGNGALSRIEAGSNNIGIGYGSGISLRTGNNNIFIGSGAGGQSTSQVANQSVNNKLCIHNIVNTSTGIGYTTNPNSFWDTAPSPHGMNTWDLGLITGDFFERWVKFNGKFIIGAGYMPNADSTYTKNIVAKPDGTFGWEDKKALEINASKGTIFPSVPNSGDLFFNTSDSKHYGFDGTNWNALY